MRGTRTVRHSDTRIRRPAARVSEAKTGQRYRARRYVSPRPPLLTRSRLRTIIGVMALATVYSCVTFVTRSPLFAVRQVNLSGLAAMQPDEAQQARIAATLPKGQNLFRLKAGELERMVERVPAVASAHVAKRFPNRVEVAVTPRVPVALLASGAERWEVDRAGVVIRPARPDVKLPEIACVAAATLSAGQRIDVPGVSGALVAAGLTARGRPLPIAKIEVDQSADMCLNMADSVAIRIGQADQLGEKLELVRRIYDERPDIGASVETIDLRFPEAPACQPRSATKRARGSSPSADALPVGLRERSATPDSADTLDTRHPESHSNQDPEKATDRPHRRRTSSRSRHSARDTANEEQDERSDSAEPRR